MKRYGLVGFPLAHSLSAQYFAEKFRRLRITDAVYENYPIQNLEDLPALIDKFPDLQGLNVTIPYKSSIIPLLDDVHPSALSIGAVNTIKVIHTGESRKLMGFNTDIIGFMNSLSPLLKTCHKSALVLGTGGSSKAVCFVLKELAIPYTLVSRTQGVPARLSYKELTPEIIRQNRLIINCTPAGMYPDFTPPDLPYTSLDNKHLLFDLVYNPEKTEFLSNGERMGAQTKNGMEMLHLQADAAWEIWNHQ